MSEYISLDSLIKEMKWLIKITKQQKSHIEHIQKTHVEAVIEHYHTLKKQSENYEDEYSDTKFIEDIAELDNAIINFKKSNKNIWEK